jgi:hypothetical protein
VAPPFGAALSQVGALRKTAHFCGGSNPARLRFTFDA